jgi:hypothetical protein
MKVSVYSTHPRNVYWTVKVVSETTFPPALADALNGAYPAPLKQAATIYRLEGHPGGRYGTDQAQIRLDGLELFFALETERKLLDAYHTFDAIQMQSNCR